MKSVKIRILAHLIAVLLLCQVSMVIPMGLFGSYPVVQPAHQKSAITGIFSAVFRSMMFIAGIGGIIYLLKTLTDGEKDKKDEGEKGKKKNRNRSRKRYSSSSSDDSDSSSEASDFDSDFVSQKKRKKYTTLGIPVEWHKYIVGAMQEDNVLFVQFKSANQFSSDVNAPVARYQKKLEKKMRSKKNPSEQDLDKIEQFAPGGTCMSQVFKNAKYAKQFLGSADIQSLEYIKAKDKAREFLQERVDNNIPTSWAENDNDIRVIRGYDNLEEDLTFLESLAQIDTAFEGSNYELAHVIRKFTNQNGSHMFMLQTGLEEQAHVFEGVRQFAHGQTEKQQRKILNSVRNRIEGGSHYYLVAVKKMGDRIHCYIFDSMNNDHMNDDEFKLRNNLLVAKLLNRKNKNTAKQKFDDYIKKVSIRDTNALKKKFSRKKKTRHREHIKDIHGKMRVVSKKKAKRGNYFVRKQHGG